MSTPVQLAALIRYKTGTNATTFTDADMLPLINLFKDEISAQIVEKNAGYFLVPSTFDLVASSTTREYAFPSDILNRMHKLELKFSSTDSYQPSTFIKDYKGSETESEIVKNFSNVKGGFAHTIRRRAMMILSGTITAVTAGGRLWSYAYPADVSSLASTTDLGIDPSITTFGFPRAFHELLARRVSIEFKGAQTKPIPLSATEKNYNADLLVQLDALSRPDEGGDLIGDPLPSQDTGDNGHNY